MDRRTFIAATATGLGAAVGGLAMPRLARAETKLSLWSHWADQDSKKKFVEDAARAFEAKHPGAKIEVTWYQKDPLYAALKTSLRARRGPDIFYAEVDQTEYTDNGLLFDLSGQLDWARIEPWAKQAWTMGKGTYGLPLEAWSVEMYYNKGLAKKLGAPLPEDAAPTQAQFADAIAKANAANVTAIVEGVGDRPYPGAFLVHEPLLRQLGKADYAALLKGKLAWDDPRVLGVLRWIKQTMVDTKALPRSYTSLKLGEAHYYFHTQPGGLMFPMGSFYPSRAFNAPDKGGQPAGFELGITAFPKMDGGKGNDSKTLAVGGSYVVNAASPNAKLAAEFLNGMATVEMGNRWLQETLVQTGIKTDPSKISGANAAYFKDLAKASEDVDYFIGLPSQHLTGGAKDAFAQVMNTAFPAGLLSPEEAAAKMKGAMAG